MSTERRRSVRVGQDLMLRTRSVQGIQDIACGGSISEEGMFVEYILPHPIGTKLAIELRLPGEATLEILATVMSAQALVPPDASQATGNGLRFEGLTDRQQEQIRAYIEAELS